MDRLISADAPCLVHPVRPEDTLAGIALRYGTDVPRLRLLNRLHSEESIFARHHLVVPLPPSCACACATPTIAPARGAAGSGGFEASRAPGSAVSSHARHAPGSAPHPSVDSASDMHVSVSILGTAELGALLVGSTTLETPALPSPPPTPPPPTVPPAPPEPCERSLSASDWQHMYTGAGAPTPCAKCGRYPCFITVRAVLPSCQSSPPVLAAMAESSTLPPAPGRSGSVVTLPGSAVVVATSSASAATSTTAADPFAAHLSRIDAEIASAMSAWRAVTATESPIVAPLDDPARPYRSAPPPPVPHSGHHYRAMSSPAATAAAGGRIVAAVLSSLRVVSGHSGHGGPLHRGTVHAAEVVVSGSAAAKLLALSPKPVVGAGDVGQREFELHALRKRTVLVPRDEAGGRGSRQASAPAST